MGRDVLGLLIQMNKALNPRIRYKSSVIKIGSPLANLSR